MPPHAVQDCLRNRPQSPRTGISVVDNDVALQVLDDQICELYSSYYELDSHDQACWFNEEQEKADKSLMLELLGKLNAASRS